MRVRLRAVYSRRLQNVLADLAMWTIGLFVGVWFRIGFSFEYADAARTETWDPWAGLLMIAGLAGVAMLVIGLVLGLYRGRWAVGTNEELIMTLATWALASLTTVAVTLVGFRTLVPTTGVVGGTVFTLCGMLILRLLWRRKRERVRGESHPDSRRVLVFGAGEGGRRILKSMLVEAEPEYVPVAFLDDDPAKSNRRIHGVEVVGTRASVAEAAEKFDADLLLVAIPSASRELVGDLFDIGRAAGLDVKILPRASDLLGKLTVADIRELTIEDLLGREQVSVDVAAIAEYVSGRRVLVTGAGGSIGSELCRQLYNFAPSELFMLDRDETGLHGVQLSIEGRALLESEELIVADIRDRDRVREIFERCRPDVVFHAAALKHVTLLERHPAEGVKTNVIGTRTVLEAAERVGVDVFVNVSTDKAADPVNVLGITKLLAEHETTLVAQQTGRRFTSVRFGNVLGSRGSVLPTFLSQIEAGGPVTVTDPDVTRFFMSIPEAVRLVLQAGAIGRPGETMILDMGEPVSIDLLARRLIEHHDPRVRIEYTGLRPGEKLHEVVMAGNEVGLRREHDRIMHTKCDVDADLPVDELASASAAELPEILARQIERARMVDVDNAEWVTGAIRDAGIR